MLLNNFDQVAHLSGEALNLLFQIPFVSSCVCSLVCPRTLLRWLVGRTALVHLGHESKPGHLAVVNCLAGWLAAQGGELEPKLLSELAPGLQL